MSEPQTNSPPVMPYESPIDAASRGHRKPPKRPNYLEDYAWAISLVCSADFLFGSFISDYYVDDILLIGMAVGLFLAMIAAARHESRQRGRRQWAGAMIAVLAPILLFSGVHSCPHATYLNLEGKTFVLSGKACGNSQLWSPWWHMNN